MKSEACRSPTEINLVASARLAIVLGSVSLLAAAAAWFNDFPLSLRLGLIGLVAVFALRSIGKALRPGLSLRILDHGLEYRVTTTSPWNTLPQNAYCFASPWFVGWRGRTWRAYGVFNVQLEPHGFRRLLVALRHQQQA